MTTCLPEFSALVREHALSKCPDPPKKIILLLALLSPAILNAFQASVAQCNADPSGQRDSTAAFAKCLALVATGDVLVPRGTYNIGGTVVMNRNQNLIGVGSRASVLSCRFSTGPCLVVADAAFGPSNYSVANIENLGIEGPGPDNTSIGIYLGGDPDGRITAKHAFADFVNIIGVRITGFNHGVQWGNNAYVNKIVRSLIFGNDTGLYVPVGLSNSGETISLTDCDIFNNRNNGIEDHGNFEWMIQGSSFDYNGTAIKFYGAHIHVVNSHFEQGGGQVFLQPYGSADLSIRDSEILVQSRTGDDSYVLSTWPQTLNLVIDDVSVWSNHPVHYFMRMQGTITGSVTNLYGNANKKIGAFSDAPGKTSLTPSQAF